MLGKYVKDAITGYTGTVTQRVELLNAPPRCYVEAPVAADGACRAEWFDEQRLSAVEKPVKG